MNYRKDIQVLRGVSILFVVLYHLNFFLIKSGFLGVDVFFVISGFLMAGLYNPSKKKQFFLRRAKRLLPAYYATLFLTVAVSVFVLLPVELNQVIQESLYGFFFSSNIGFWQQNSYFSTAEYNPLLHLWSIGVEIQYYLIVPVLYALFCRSRYAYILLTIFSSLICFYILSISPKTSFFMMPLRLWEFSIGFLAQKIPNNIFSDFQKNFLSFIGLIGLIVMPFLHIDVDSLSFFSSQPGLVALGITLCTGLVLLCGIPEVILDLKISRILEVIGQYSYSIYLVHFPIIVLFLYQPFKGTVTQVNGLSDFGFIIFTMTLFSLVFYHVIEQPGRTIVFNRKKLIVISFGALTLICFAISSLKLFYTKKEQNIFAAWTDRSTYRCGKIFRLLHPFEVMCKITDISNAKGNTLLVGNSHADSIKTSFAKSAASARYNVYFMVTNTPLMKGDIDANKIIDVARQKNISEIILHYSPDALSPKNILDFANLAHKANMTVSFIMPVPIYDQHIPQALYKHVRYGTVLSTQDRKKYDAFNSRLIEEIAHAQLKIYEVAPVFCEKTCLLMTKNSNPIYFDTGHLTLSGAKLLEPVFDNLFQKIGQN